MSQPFALLSKNGELARSEKYIFSMRNLLQARAVIQGYSSSNRRLWRFFLNGNGHTDGRIYGRTDPHIEMRGRI